VYLASEDGPLPDEPRRLTLVLAGPREPESWQGGDRKPIDFYDLKGVIETLLAGLRINGATYEAAQHPTFYPGRTARVIVAISGSRVTTTRASSSPNARLCS